MNIFNYLIDEDKINYKCYDELKKLILSNKGFQNKVEGKIKKFPQELWEKIKNQNIRGINSFEDVFIDGANIGYCTVAAKQLSYSLNNCLLCGGVLPILKGSINCPDGSHTWILYNHKIIDTTLMLIIDEEYAKILGFQEENRYNPDLDPIYRSTKLFTNDTSLKKSK